MSTRHTAQGGHRRGFSLLEVQAAFIVLGFSMAALFPFAVTQLRLVAALEKRVPPNTTFVLVSRDNHMLNIVAAGTGGNAIASPLSKPPSQGPATEAFGPATRPISINSVTPGAASEWTAKVTVDSSSSGGQQ